MEIVDNEVEDYFNNRDIPRLSDFIRSKIAIVDSKLVWIHGASELESTLICEQPSILTYEPPSASLFDEFDEQILEGQLRLPS